MFILRIRGYYGHFQDFSSIWDIFEVSSYSKEFEGILVILVGFFLLILLVSRGILSILEVSRLLWAFKRFRGIFCRFEVLEIFWSF